MSNQEQESTETKTASETTDIPSNHENIEKSDEHVKSSSSPAEVTISNEQETATTTTTTTTTTRRMVMTQDIRYATEQGDREKLMAKYENYQVSDSNSCIIHFLTDNRQKKNLLGGNEGTHLNKNFPPLFLLCRRKS